MDKPQKKVLIISSLGPPPYLGGIENVIDTLIKSSLSSSYDFSTFDTYRKPAPNRSVFSKAAFALRLPFQCAYYISKVRPHIAHIHFCSKTDFWKHSLCLFACKTMRIKTIFHLHGGSFDTIYNQYRPLTQSLVRFILAKADMIIALSTYWKDFLSTLVEKDKISIAPNPINCSQLSFFSNQETKILNPSVLLLGSLGKRKGHFDVIKAIPTVLSKHPLVHFYFAGLEEDYGATERLKELAEETNIITNVHFLGAVAGEEKLKLLGEAGIVILPSYGENMPISVLEGMAAWKPVISTRVGAIPEVIDDNESGILIDAGDWQALSQKISYLFDNPQDALQIGARAGKKVRKKWDVDIITLTFDQIYKNILLGVH